MAISRVLVLQSVEDDLTRRRIARNRASPSLKHLVIDYCYAVELTRDQQQMYVEQVMDQVMTGSIDEGALLRRIDEKVASFLPDILIVHAGFVFCTFPRVFLSVLSSLKSKHPALRFASEALYRIESPWREMLDRVIERSANVDTLARLIV